MKQTSETVITKIMSIEETFNELQQKYLIGFKMESSQVNLQKYENI